MSTSAVVSYTDVRRNPFSFYNAACFGTLNRLDSSVASGMKNLEWHPTSRNTTLRKAFDLVNSFGMWKDVFYFSSIGSVGVDLTENKADCAITGLMFMRDTQHGGSFNTIFSRRTDDDRLLKERIEFSLYAAGILKNRYARPEQNLFVMNNVHMSEGTVCNLPPDLDAIALYLMVYGSKAEFEGCWAQNHFGEAPNQNGYVRNSSQQSSIRHIQRTRPTWRNMADWLMSWLNTRPVHLESKLGRMTVRQFYDRLNSRVNLEADLARKEAVLLEVFEELREFYS